MANIVDSIGFDLERVHTGLIVYLVKLWCSVKKEPLQTFFSELGVELHEAEEIRARTECKNIDLVICNQADEPLVAVEMKVHNHEELVVVKGSSGEKAYQTEEYSGRIGKCTFLYVALGAGEFYRREPYGDVKHIGLDRLLAAVARISAHDQIIGSWERALTQEQEFRRQVRGEPYDANRKNDEKYVKKWNVYFLGFLREALDKLNFGSTQVDFTAYRHSQDTILNAGIERPAKTEGAYCYMEINANGKLNLKADLKRLGGPEEKRSYVDRARRHYELSVSDRWSPQRTGEVRNLKNSRMLLSFDVGIEKQDKFFGYTEDKERSCERIRDIICWFSDKPPVETN